MTHLDQFDPRPGRPEPAAPWWYIALWAGLGLATLAVVVWVLTLFVQALDTLGRT